MSWIKRVLQMAVVCCLCSQALFAQSVSGHLVDSLVHTPIERAFIVLLDETDSELARVLTDAQGRFSLDALGADTFRLRSERIGSRAGLSESFELVAGTNHELEMLVNPIVVRLDTFTVSGDSKRCRVVGE